ncbi:MULTISPECIES: alpha/beta fold hydrolase [unclassified Archaeoglobus]|jgi:pimeloyl-ACP methyl ester carboxylesterase|uniref:alpha/beta fold hydrolase n=1 Tax=unclassified Archaeoglobus TaxID=2643606 RepID=UPI0025BDFD29|nr:MULTISPECIES: alpha/beta hydrolase [unclassified Archaeoglobus]
MERVEVDVDAVKLSFLKGKDVDIVYIHGSGCDATLWESQLSDIGGYAVDMPNHGESCKAEIRDIDDYAYFVAKAIKKILGEAIVVGHSLGGAVAQKVYLNHPKVVKGLILVGTGVRLRVLPQILEGLKEKPEETAKMTSRYAFSDEKLADEFSKLFAERATILLKDLSLCNRFDLLEKYRGGEIKIDVPTLIIVGEKDMLTPVKYSEFLKQHIPNSEMVVIPEAGHMVMLEKPEEFNRAVKEFLKKF